MRPIHPCSPSLHLRFQINLIPIPTDVFINLLYLEIFITWNKLENKEEYENWDQIVSEIDNPQFQGIFSNVESPKIPIIMCRILEVSELLLKSRLYTR